MKYYDYWKKSQITDISNCSYWLYQKGVGIYEVGKDQAFKPLAAWAQKSSLNTGENFNLRITKGHFQIKISLKKKIS